MYVYLVTHNKILSISFIENDLNSVEMYFFFVVDNYGVAWQWETWENDFDQAFTHSFDNGDQVGFLSGMSSYHDNGREDRRFK